MDAQPQGIVRIVDPIHDHGWNAWLATHEAAGFFEGSAWARVLHDAYDHRPFYFCKISNRQLNALLPTMEVSSPLTGRRGVSLPFTDLCESLTSEIGDADELRRAAHEIAKQRHWRYLECRSSDGELGTGIPSLEFYGHEIDLERHENELSSTCDPAVRRAIRKAERHGLEVTFSTDAVSVLDFYHLHCFTRKRHGVPPQPFHFFDLIQHHVLEAGAGFVASARYGQKVVAAGIYLYQNGRAFYKFGASDFGYQHLRPNNLLMWRAMLRCKGMGCRSLHLGRTSLANKGLRQFKLGFGAREKRIRYNKFDYARGEYVVEHDRATSWLTRVFRVMPLPLLRLAGRHLYPHLS